MAEDQPDISRATVARDGCQRPSWSAHARVVRGVGQKFVPQPLEADRATSGGDPNVPGKAIRAMKIASEHPEGQSIRPREGVEEGLLLSRVALECAHVPMRDHQRTALVVADLADAAQAVKYQEVV